MRHSSIRNSEAKFGRYAPGNGILKLERSVRVFHGPRNVAGIGGYLSDWQRKNGAISDFVVLWQDQTHRKNHHIRLDLGARKRIAQWYLRLSYFLFAAIQYDIFHFYGETTLLGGNADLPLLKLLGKKILITYCGSDVRQASVLKKQNPYFELVESNPQDRPERDKYKKRIVRRQSRWADRIIVGRNTYYSVKGIVPERKIIKDLWIHTTVDCGAVEPSQRSEYKTVVVVHAPSHRGIKGTRYIEDSVERIRGQGISFEYHRIENKPHSEMMRILRDEADIVVDQLLYGGFGVLAVEAMAHGLPVCCYMIEEVKAELYPDVPIVNVTIETLDESLRWLIENPEERRALGAKGRRFVEKYCDRSKLNERLWTVYEDVVGQQLPRNQMRYGQVNRAVGTSKDKEAV